MLAMLKLAGGRLLAQGLQMFRDSSVGLGHVVPRFDPGVLADHRMLHVLTQQPACQRLSILSGGLDATAFDLGLFLAVIGK
jgi:hypothetical protein